MAQFQATLIARCGENRRKFGSHVTNCLYFHFDQQTRQIKFQNILLDDSLATFPYVNGRLFEETLPITTFDRQMRGLLLDCSRLDWGRISPAIFGSLFQSAMNPVERRNLGAHYTSEKNIMKVIRPLFLDALRAEFESVKTTQRLLLAFHSKLASLRFLDPACGCGNFLIITYRELRLLEIEVIKAIQKGQQVVSVNDWVLVDVDKFCGIEYEEFPAQIAQVAMWLMDHQMNLRISEEFGQYYARLPLRKSATVVHGNALRTDWQSLLPEPKDDGTPYQYSYIIGNPPFIGSKMMNEAQRSDLLNVMVGVDGAGVLDYVSGWYWRAAQYMQGRTTRTAFVSTNSITQGEPNRSVFCGGVCCGPSVPRFTLPTRPSNGATKRGVTRLCSVSS